MIDGNRSHYDLTHRDTLPDPLASLDAELLNRAADALTRIETWAQNSATVVPLAAQAPALVVSVQRWLWTCQSSGTTAACLLDLSPAFLEDAGVLPRQTDAPDQPLVSLAQDVSLSVPTYSVLPKDLAGLLGAQRTPQPAWVNEMCGVKFLHFSVRLFNGTGTDVFHLENPLFFDAGTGVSPKVVGTLMHSTPDNRTTPIPQSTYEICLLVMNWAD